MKTRFVVGYHQGWEAACDALTVIVTPFRSPEDTSGHLPDDSRVTPREKTYGTTSRTDQDRELSLSDALKSALLEEMPSLGAISLAGQELTNTLPPSEYNPVNQVTLPSSFTDGYRTGYFECVQRVCNAVEANHHLNLQSLPHVFRWYVLQLQQWNDELVERPQPLLPFTHAVRYTASPTQQLPADSPLMRIWRS